MSLSTYSKIERGVTDMTLTRLDQIASIFKMTRIEVLTYGSNTFPHSMDCKKLLEEKDKEIMKLQKELIKALKMNKKNI
jgi:transcriptional regulator with XRE-family HTH domain